MVILFATISNFPEFNRERGTRSESVATLNEILVEFDVLCLKFGVHKIKTNGTTYMAICGLQNEAPRTVASFALALRRCQHELNRKFNFDFVIRIGINVGPCVAGVLGRQKFWFDIWGDAVNVASRMETSSEGDHIQITESVADLLKDNFVILERGPVHIKGKGAMTTYYLEDENPLRRVSASSMPANVIFEASEASSPEV